ncbi:Creatinase/aminopeptidase [Macrolepiota fuliginosa MF-IS2]|uniref:Creatinase/aminopeptidase n=1 Tax=Macrolepiota fuliginosa MF-IS2 TaxID=1400762 RepID=A0A9P6C9K8_9AGAR|nr:Creatinase/aminopeptidase [Macrolepiota fuliginosa MF-IS2]
MGELNTGSATVAQPSNHKSSATSHGETKGVSRFSNGSLRKCLLLLIVSLVFLIHLSHWRPDLAKQRLGFPPSAVKDILSPSASALRHPCILEVPPVSKAEYLSRQARVAQILQDLNAVAYIAEPGAQTQFLANFSTTNWKLSERPLLVIITPQTNDKDKVTARVSLLTPKFEATRARLLDIPSVSEYIEWAEEEDPYAVAIKALGLISNQDPRTTVDKKIYIDSSARHLHYDGFQHALSGSNLVAISAPKDINELRERKSEAEIEILKCVNEATLVAMRHVYKKMSFGIRESEARNMMSAAFAEIGLSNGGCLTLFGENAALPHGSGTDRPLKPTDFALFDCTASLHGYWSDITRTVALPSSQLSASQWRTWNAVRLAQQAAIHTARSNITARFVDQAARKVLHNLKLDKYFTHRLGHGIGLEVHERPYLNGGSEDVIQTGNTFSNEPGVYIEGEVGVRLEDCFFIDSDGSAVFLTIGVGGPSESPYKL